MAAQIEGFDITMSPVQVELHGIVVLATNLRISIIQKISVAINLLIRNLVILSTIVAVTTGARGGNGASFNWQFSGDRQPYYEKLFPTTLEDRKADCSRWTEVLYENYANLHPRFRPLMHDQSLYKEWRKSLILRGDGGIRTFNICFYRLLGQRIVDRPNNPKSRKLFCGIKARDLNAVEKKSAEAAEELNEYAMMGRFNALVTILNDEYRTSPIRYNVDVKYYFQLLINKNWPVGNNLHDVMEDFLIPDAGAMLDRERRIFVEEAFARGDYKAVLATTEPCRTYWSPGRPYKDI